MISKIVIGIFEAGGILPGAASRSRPREAEGQIGDNHAHVQYVADRCE